MVDAQNITWRSSRSLTAPGLSQLLLYAGLAAVAVPTLIGNARQEWSLEQGQQGPIVLALGLWLLWRRWPAMRAGRETSSRFVSCAAMAAGALAYVFGRVSDQILVESYALYGLGIAALYAIYGLRGLRAAWFPLAYLLFALPAPYTLTFIMTHQLRLWVTGAAVQVCQWAGLSVVRDGLHIMVDQYDLAVQEACSGMNSLISLSAIGLLYVFIRRNPAWWYLAAMVVPIVLFAILGNFVRVLVLIGLTHGFGDAVAQSYLHETAGLVTFSTALLAVIGLDALAGPFAARAEGRREAPSGEAALEHAR